MPGRYWGEGQGPTASPSQASALLARINSRARERKAGAWQGKLGRLGDGPGTPEHKTLVTQDGTPREDIKQGRATTPKDHQYNAVPPPLESGGEVKHRLNGARTEELWTGEGEDVKKTKRKKKDSEGESKSFHEVSKILSPQKEGLFGLQVEEGSDVPVTKKKKKKRKRDEELQGGEEVESVIPDTEMEDSDLVKKKKKRHKEIENEEEEIIVDREDSNLIETEKKKHEHEKINGEGAENFSEAHEHHQRKKKRRSQVGEEEDREKTGDKEIKLSQPDLANISQQVDNISLSSPAKKKKHRKMEIKEEENVEESNSQDLSSIKVPNRKIKEEVPHVLEDVEMEHTGGELHVEGVNKGWQEAEMDGKRGKRKKLKKKPKKDKKDKSEVGGFTLLTEVEATKKQKVQRTLPHWLANPTVIGRDLTADGAPVDSFLGLDSSLKELLKQRKIKQLFPVQRAVIPELLASGGPLSCRYRPRDVCVSAPTGSGKTLAYVLPLVQVLKSRTVPRIRALVLLPVQELAMQVYQVFLSYCKGTSLHVGKAVGHTTLQKEQSALVSHHLGRHHSLVDILVATPGRLADHLRVTRGLDLSALRYLVLDEADRMLAAEGGEWVAQVQRAIADHQASQDNQPLLRPPLQRLLFSATLSSDPEQLQHIDLHHPKLFTVAAAAAGQDKSVAVVMGQYVRPAELTEEYVMVEEQVKPLALHHLLVSGEGRQRVLVFTNSVQTTHKLAILLATLSEGTTRVVEEFSSKRDKRQQIISRFAAGKIDVLVSSDAMARGLDVPDIDHVVSYDVTAATTYVHRIGRTARAGRPGTALSLVTKPTLAEFRKGLLGGGEGARQLTLTPDELESYEQQYIDALANLRKILEEEERQKRLNHENGKAKKTKKNRRQKARQQKRDMRTARLAEKKAREGKAKVTVNANRLHHYLKRP